MSDGPQVQTDGPPGESKPATCSNCGSFYASQTPSGFCDPCVQTGRVPAWLADDSVANARWWTLGSLWTVLCFEIGLGGLVVYLLLQGKAVASFYLALCNCCLTSLIMMRFFSAIFEPMAELSRSEFKNWVIIHICAFIFLIIEVYLSLQQM